MYSIMIRDAKEASKWSFYLDEDEAVWEGSLAEVKAEVTKLLATTTTGRIKVVHNTTIDFSGIVITDVEA